MVDTRLLGCDAPLNGLIWTAETLTVTATSTSIIMSVKRYQQFIFQ
jgi:uncharacterized protein (DUF302 family)